MRVRVISACFILACLLGPAQATSSYAYRSDEYATVRNGEAPSRKYSVAAHGNGESGDEDFHLYLMAEPGHRRIGPLEEVTEILDTAPSAYEAVWSPNSRYVALFYRSDRHVRAMTLYRIERGRAYLITGPTLLAAAVGARLAGSDDVEVRSRNLELTWSGPGRFLLKQHGIVAISSPRLATKFGAFGRLEPPSADATPGKTFLAFSAQAECEVGTKDEYRITDLKPGPAN